MIKKYKYNCSVMKKVLHVFMWFCLFLILNCKSENIEKENTDNNPYEFHIGGVLSSNASEDYFKQTIEVMYTFFYKYFYNNYE